MKKCDHEWRDFDWYSTSAYEEGGALNMVIYEPYVCTKCKERKDVVLCTDHYDNIDMS